MREAVPDEGAATGSEAGMDRGLIGSRMEA